MEIQLQGQQRKSDSQDSWDPEQCNSIKDQHKPSLFQKITISFDDQTIQKNVDTQCEKPILNSQLFPFKDQENEDQMNLQQTQEEQSKNVTFDPKIQQTHMMEAEQVKKPKNTAKPMENEQALFNAIQDEENEHWMRKKLRNGVEKTSKISRPLTCPQCFTQICYTYQACRKTSKDEEKRQNLQPNNVWSNEKTYKAKVVDNVIIHEHKIIRNRFASQNMQKRPNFKEKQDDEKIGAKRLEKYQKDLKDRYEDINVKILVSCQQCGLDLGYWDANQQLYELFNVI